MSVSDVSSGRDEEPLPPIVWTSIVLSAIIRELERRHRGAADRIRDDIESEERLLSVVRIRGPRAEPSIRHEYAKARRWIDVLWVFMRRGRDG